MEGSADDLGAPDSWELADLEESMTRLILSSKNDTAASESPLPDFPLPDSIDESAAIGPDPFSSSLSASVAAAGPFWGDGSNQVDPFLKEALQNPRERLSVLRMEQDVLKFIHDPTQQQLEFQQLPTSYLRLAAHRVAQHYCLQSMVMSESNSPDGSGSRIVVRKTSECQLPLIRLADIPVDLPQEDKNNVIKIAIKQRPQKRLQATSTANAHSSKENHSKSVEERKEEYNRARARIFSSNISGGSEGPTVPDSLQHSVSSARVEEKASTEGPEIVSLGRGSGDSSIGSSSSSSNNNTTTSSRSSRSRTEKEPVTRNKGNNRVAIFRDREVDRKDPDYDRSYDRYMQRFDPGFGFSGGQYTMQPMYSPALNYNTEFPQLGSAHRPQISIEHQPRPIPQHMRGPWPTASTPTAISYGPPGNIMAPYNSTSAIYLHSSQYACPRPGMTFHPHEHVHQPFAQVRTCQPGSTTSMKHHGGQYALYAVQAQPKCCSQA